MKLILEQIKKITFGALDIIESSNGFEFFRFPSEVMSKIKENDEYFYLKSQATASIHLSFFTNSSFFRFKMKFLANGTSRNYYYASILVNDVEQDLIGVEQIEEKKVLEYQINLDTQKENKIDLYLPNLVSVSLFDVEIEDLAFIKEINKENDKILIYGDSISQGYDAIHPQNSYANLLSKLTNKEVINNAIGSMCFNDYLINDLAFKTIIIFLGTNDFVNKEKNKQIIEACQFLAKVKIDNPNANIIFISPIRRNDEAYFNRPFVFEKYRIKLLEIAKTYKIKAIDGYKLLANKVKYYQKDRLHPTDEGHITLANNIYASLKEIL